MEYKIVLMYLPYALVSTFTPGPNNLMSFYAVSHYGFRNGSKVIFGIMTGFITCLIICGIFCHELAVYVPKLVNYLKYFGALYMLWLAYKIFNFNNVPNETEASTINFLSGFLLAITNIKVILYFITVYTAYVIPSNGNFLIHGIYLFMLACISWGLWASAGNLLQKFFIEHYRAFNILMAMLLAYCAIAVTS